MSDAPNSTHMAELPLVPAGSSDLKSQIPDFKSEISNLKSHIPALKSEISDLKSERPLATPLPSPTKTRWHPLRSGLFNLYRYDDEEFVFEQGRLLLRGNNGTGKSRVLALQLPFLLDGETAPHRVEPDGDVAKRIEWNLLLGKYPDRLGYTWIEFGRRESDGTEHFITLGCGLRAVEGRSGVDRWFFITPLRLRRDFSLQTDQRQPLSHERLAEILAGRGELFREASRYREAVDRTLFGLGDRYGAMIELLLRLRQPQLARKLDEKLLSAALGEALTPLRNDLLDTIAESFRGLDADRADLAAQQEIARAVAVFLADYRRYLRIAVRRRAATVRSGQSAYEEAQRALRAAERMREDGTARRNVVQEELARAQGERAGAEGALKAFQESPEMRSLQALQRTRDETQEKEGALGQAEGDFANADREAIAANENELRLAAEADVAREAAKTSAAAADHAAHEASLAEPHREATSVLTGTTEPAATARIRAATDALLRQRRQALAHLRTLQKAVSDSAQAHQTALSRLHDRETTLRAAESAEIEARTALASAGDALLAHYRTWITACRELAPIPAADLVEAFSGWIERREGPSPLEQALQIARTVAADTFGTGRARLAQRRAALDEEAAAIADEIARLERGTHAPPIAPALRTADRAGRPGAPLWRVCDFKPDLSAEACAGLEAALEASGLLDAWLLPDGTLLDPATDDTFLLNRPAGLAEGAALTDWLQPSLDTQNADTPALTADSVGRALNRIGAGCESGEHWVSLDGGWPCVDRPRARGRRGREGARGRG